MCNICLHKDVNIFNALMFWLTPQNPFASRRIVIQYIVTIWYFTYEGKLIGIFLFWHSYWFIEKVKRRIPTGR